MYFGAITTGGMWTGDATHSVQHPSGSVVAVFGHSKTDAEALANRAYGPGISEHKISASGLHEAEPTSSWIKRADVLSKSPVFNEIIKANRILHPRVIEAAVLDVLGSRLLLRVADGNVAKHVSFNTVDLHAFDIVEAVEAKF